MHYQLEMQVTSENWVVDSGATCHICNDRDQFDVLSELEKPIDVTVGDGFTLKAMRQGTVKTKIKLPNGKSRKSIFHNVLYVPELSYSHLVFQKQPKGKLLFRLMILGVLY